MRLATRSAVLSLAIALGSCVVLPAARADAGDAVLAPDESWRKAFAWPGGENADHVLLTTPGEPWGTPSPATLYSLSGGSVEVGTFEDAASGRLFQPALLGGTLGLPVAGDSVFSPASVTFREIASGDEHSIAIAATERMWSYAGAGTIVVGTPDATDTSRTDLYLRSSAGDVKVFDNAQLVGGASWVLADSAGAVVYDGGRMISYVDFATKAVHRVDDVASSTDVTARPTYLTATEIGYRNSSELVRVPRSGGTAVRVAYSGNVDAVRHVGSLLVLSRYAYPRYELVTIPDTGGTPAVVATLTDNQIAEYGAGEVAAFGIVGNGTSGRVAIDVVTGATRMLVALTAPPAAPRGIALSGGRVAVSDDHVHGDRLTQASVDPAAETLAFGPRTPLAVRPYSDNSCNGGICGPVAAFGSLTAFIQEPTTYAHTGDLVVLDGTTEIARIAVTAHNAWFDLGSDHLLYSMGSARRLRNLRTGADAATTLQAIWGPYGYGITNGDVVRTHLGTGAVDVARAAGGGCTPDWVTGRGPWVRWHAWCTGVGDEYQVRNVDTASLVNVPEWARTLGDGIAVGWNGATLTSVDLVAEGQPQTSITTTTSAFAPVHTWAVDETGGRLVAFRDESDQSVRVRRLAGPTSAVTLLRQLVGAPAAGSWRPEADYSGGVDWTLTIAGGTPQEVVLSGSATDGVVRPVWNVAAVTPGTYPFVLSATARDGSTSPADVTGSVVVPAATALALSALPAAVTYPTAVPLVATLTSGASGVAGQTVVLETRKPGAPSWTVVGSRTTSATGVTAALGHVPAAAAEYRARFAGMASYLASTSASRLVAVATKVTATASVASALNGTTFRISGAVSPAHTGSVLLQRGSGTTWSTIATGTLTGSAYAFTQRPTATGVYKYRVVKPADSDNTAGISPTVTYTAYRVAITSISATSEYAILKNTGTTTVNLGSWVLDAGTSTERFRLPSYSLLPGRSLRVVTGYGTNGGGVIFLRRSAGIWATHDTGSLYDQRGALSSRLRY